MRECGTCGGRYAPILPDGYRYFHACAPVWDADLKTYVERPDKRDENIQIVDDGQGGTAAVIKSEGNGAADAVET